MLMALGTVPTPLWPLYQARDGFDSTTVTVVFAVLVVGAAASLFFFGHLSDRMGRRRIIVPALVLALAGAVTMALYPDLPGLIIGRLLTGAAVGLMAPTATVYLADLYRAGYPDAPADSAVPAVVATAANLGGLALGPLIAGALAQWAPRPLATPYVVFGLVLLLATLLIVASPETVDRDLPAHLLPVKFGLRPGATTALAGAAAMGFCAFAALGLFSSLGSLVIRELGVTSHFVGGLAAFAVLAFSAIAQLALSSLPAPKAMRAGMFILPVGLLLVSVAMYFPSLWLYLLAAAVCGSGAGVLFKGAISASVAVAAPASRAGVVAVLLVVAYIGMGLPSIILTVVDRVVGARVSMIGFAAVLSIGTVTPVCALLSTNRASREATL